MFNSENEEYDEGSNPSDWEELERMTANILMLLEEFDFESPLTPLEGSICGIAAREVVIRTRGVEGEKVEYTFDQDEQTIGLQWVESHLPEPLTIDFQLTEYANGNGDEGEKNG